MATGATLFEIAGIVGTFSGGLYVAIRNWSGDTRDQVKTAILDATGPLAAGQARIEATQTRQGNSIVEHGERLSRVEGHLGIFPEGSEFRRRDSDDPGRVSGTE